MRWNQRSYLLWLGIVLCTLLSTACLFNGDENIQVDVTIQNNSPFTAKISQEELLIHVKLTEVMANSKTILSLNIGSELIAVLENPQETTRTFTVGHNSNYWVIQ